VGTCRLDHLEEVVEEHAGHVDLGHQVLHLDDFARIDYRFELFEFGLIQTDPNFANFLYNAQTGKLGLLDFGATRRYPSTVTEAYRRLLAAALRNDEAAMSESARAIGYFKEHIHANQRAAVMKLFMLATEPARTGGRFDFGASDLAVRIRDAGMALSFEQGYWHTPPADAVFLHRKLGGLYLLAARLGANIDLRAILERHLSQNAAIAPMPATDTC